MARIDRNKFTHKAAADPFLPRLAFTNHIIYSAGISALKSLNCVYFYYFVLVP